MASLNLLQDKEIHVELLTFSSVSHFSNPQYRVIPWLVHTDFVIGFICIYIWYCTNSKDVSNSWKLWWDELTEGRKKRKSNTSFPETNLSSDFLQCFTLSKQKIKNLKRFKFLPNFHYIVLSFLFLIPIEKEKYLFLLIFFLSYVYSKFQMEIFWSFLIFNFDYL